MIDGTPQNTRYELKIIGELTDSGIIVHLEGNITHDVFLCDALLGQGRRLVDGIAKFHTKDVVGPVEPGARDTEPQRTATIADTTLRR